jgi:hypothetical protein
MSTITRKTAHIFEGHRLDRVPAPLRTITLDEYEVRRHFVHLAEADGCPARLRASVEFCDGASA